MKFIVAFLLLLGLSLLAVLPAEAKSFCRSSGDRSICILSIKRSAKNHWEYRAAVSVDGVARPIEAYNCRDRLRIRQDGKAVRFEAQGPGELICNMFMMRYRPSEAIALQWKHISEDFRYIHFV
ncbi:MAG: hypothetical protein KME12_13750 [Trichocoleus desertorum ATA4-8-CV12]|jgi:hypothetical protein|nr:hypothetical protein [Trichocoleus desertorum ATA4-8-CV12]